MNAKNGAVNVATIILTVIAVVSLIMGYSMYQKRERRLAYEEHVRREAERQEREKAEAERKAAEEKAEKEFAQKKKEQERIEAERMEARRIAKQKADAATAEKGRLLKLREAWMTEYSDARNLFVDRPAKIWIDTPAEDRPKLEEGRMSHWCVFASHNEDKILYKVEFNELGKMVVKSINGSNEPRDVDAVDFAKRCEIRLNLIAVQGEIWIRGIPKNGALYGIPQDEKDFLPVAAETWNLYETIADFGITFEGIATRMTLRSKDGKNAIVLGVIGYDEAFDYDKIEDAVEDFLEQKKQKGASSYRKTSGPKLKRFKRTVAFYDGDIIKKDMHGVTHIPRSFVFLGTTNYDYHFCQRQKDAARKKWEALRDEAERQDQLEAEIQLENERRIAEYNRKQEQQAANLKNALKVKNHEIAAELKNWLIQVERGKRKKQATK